MSKPRLTNETLQNFAENEEQLLAAVEEGKRALQEGRTVNHAAVVAAFERIVSLHS